VQWNQPSRSTRSYVWPPKKSRWACAHTIHRPIDQRGATRNQEGAR
jgi:hypothetical protein